MEPSILNVRTLKLPSSFHILRIDKHNFPDKILAKILPKEK